jgi:SAM-dependent methyltransferase
MERFFELFESVPRQGPGCAASTLRALWIVPSLPDAPAVLDLGCGSGAPTAVLAEALPAARLTALDIHPPFLAQLRERAAREGWADRVETVRGSIDALPFPPESFDLAWAEGSLFAVGVEKGLSSVLPLLRRGACLAWTDLAWLSPDRPEAARKFLGRVCPAMTDAAGNLALARKAGYEVLGHFPLPVPAWEDEYYRHLEPAVERLLSAHPGEEESLAVAAMMREEIAAYRALPGAYGYVFVVARKP